MLNMSLLISPHPTPQTLKVVSAYQWPVLHKSLLIFEWPVMFKDKNPCVQT